MSAEVDLAPWSGLVLGERLGGGARSEVWRGRLDGRDVAVRRSRRSAPSFDWELDLMAELEASDFVVPGIVASDDGRRRVGDLVVQEWVVGREPTTDDDWSLVAAELQRLHRVTSGHAQRPDCCQIGQLGPIRRSVDADLDRVPSSVLDRVLAVFAEVVACEVAVAVIHGDTHPGNIRLDDDGRVGFLDWDESRVDVVWHDLSSLGVRVLPADQHALAKRLSHGWEAINGWVVEPVYAARRFRELTDRD